MNQVTPEVRDLAQWLLAQEGQETGDSRTTAETAFSAFEKLRVKWVKVIGVNGYQALLSRALVLAQVSVSWSLETERSVWLAAAHVNADGVLSGGRTAEGTSGDEGSVEVMAQMLGLLISFIGEDLTLNLVRDVWPGASLGKKNPVLKDTAE